MGVAAAIAVAGAMTFADWRLNPGGIFRGPAGTEWRVVAETAWSWFWPVLLAVTALAATASLARDRRAVSRLPRPPAGGPSGGSESARSRSRS